jgi:hypothetical protein
MKISKENIRNYVENIRNADKLTECTDPDEIWDKSNEIYKEINGLYSNSHNDLYSLSIDIKFSNTYYSESLKINYSGNNARARVVSLYDAIFRIFDKNKNHNYLYHPSFGKDLLFLMLSGLSTILFIILILRKYYVLSLILISITIVHILFVSLARKTHPYFLFYSRKSERYKKWNNWFVYNVLFIFFVNIVFFILRKFF